MVALWATAAALDAARDWVAHTALPPLSIEVGTEVLARDGSLLRAFQVSDGRWRLAPGPVDERFIAMLLAFEDHRFYDHAGVDMRAMARAVVQAVLNGRIISGGSTLTMQVARLLEDGPTGTFRGKLRQIRVALALEQRLNKVEILDLYLRLAPYGGNLEGVRAASLAWFGKEPRRLTPGEAALLVALPQSPEMRRPDRAPEAAHAARDRVLARLAADDGVLPADEATAATRESVPTARRAFPLLAPHLTERLHSAFPESLRIATTIDPALQRAAEALAARAVAGQEAQVTAAMILADHQSGEILAHVGAAEWSSDARAGFVDMTTALRSPGSTLKPFVYALAFDDGLAHPETLIEDRPTAFGDWRPQNFDRQFRGTVTVRAALQASLNIPVVSLTEAVGPTRLLATLRRAGVETQVEGTPGLAVALGGVGVSLEGLVQAYAALARLGAPITLSPLPGQSAPLVQRLFGPVAGWQVADILAGLPPPAGAAPGRVAYKTGTSYGHRDALALGFDGRHVAGVWLGRADGTPVPGAFGGELAAPLLFELIGRAKNAPDPLPPPPAATLLLPTERLPLPLQRFRPRDAAFSTLNPDAPELMFPPNGALVEAPGGALAVKILGGTAPFTWLANGVPVALAIRARETTLPMPGPGAVTLSVIDARGNATSADITLR